MGYYLVCAMDWMTKWLTGLPIGVGRSGGKHSIRRYMLTFYLAGKYMN